METPKRVLRNLHHANVQDTNTPFKVPASPLMKSLGYGTGVNVYYLERSPRPSGQLRSPWAIKRVSKRIRANNTEHGKLFNERILKEADILRKLKHPNIVGFRGLKQEDDGLDSLALECCTISLGLLLEERLDDGLGALPPDNIKKMMCDISSALDYLHTEAKLLHGDLKSHNVLVKGDFKICKLCDFGVSLPLNDKGVVNFKENPTLQYVGTNLWCAPEVIAEEDIIDDKAEIFSFGLIIYETIALVPPHTLSLDDGEDNESEIDTENDNSIITIDDDEDKPGDFTRMEMAYGTRPALPQAFELNEDYNIVVELFYLCTNANPENRPSAKVIYESLTADVKE